MSSFDEKPIITKYTRKILNNNNKSNKQTEEEEEINENDFKFEENSKNTKSNNKNLQIEPDSVLNDYSQLKIKRNSLHSDAQNSGNFRYDSILYSIDKTKQNNSPENSVNEIKKPVPSYPTLSRPSPSRLPPKIYLANKSKMYKKPLRFDSSGTENIFEIQPENPTTPIVIRPSRQIRQIRVIEASPLPLDEPPKTIGLIRNPVKRVAFLPAPKPIQIIKPYPVPVSILKPATPATVTFNLGQEEKIEETHKSPIIMYHESDPALAKNQNLSQTSLPNSNNKSVSESTSDLNILNGRNSKDHAHRNRLESINTLLDGYYYTNIDYGPNNNNSSEARKMPSAKIETQENVTQPKQIQLPVIQPLQSIQPFQTFQPYQTQMLPNYVQPLNQQLYSRQFVRQPIGAPVVYQQVLVPVQPQYRQVIRQEPILPNYPSQTSERRPSLESIKSGIKSVLGQRPQKNDKRTLYPKNPVLYDY